MEEEKIYSSDESSNTIYQISQRTDLNYIKHFGCYVYSHILKPKVC